MENRVGPPETRYTRVGDADVAYQIVGDGPLDLCYFIGVGHIDVWWDQPLYAKFLDGLASFSRLILFDRRGTGASDPVPSTPTPTWELWAEDLRSVLDAANSTSAAIFAEVEAGPISALFATMQPQRVSALVLANTTARLVAAEDYPIGVAPGVKDGILDLIAVGWGTPAIIGACFPSMADDAEFGQWMARNCRAAATPRSAVTQYRYIFETMDARQVLPLIQVPTLVMHNRGHPTVPIEHGRYLAAHIPKARFVELPGQDMFAFTDSGATVVDEVAQFLTGEPPAVEIDRILTTVLFTDIVRSTEHAASLGDHCWRSLLDDHDRIIRSHLHRFRGQEIKTTGDGFLASFDGPARAIRCAREVTGSVRSLGIEVRAGLHTGECEVRGEDLGGLAVHIAARIGGLAQPSEVLVSSTVKDLVAGSGIEFSDRGEHELKGVPGIWRLFEVRG